MRETAVKVNLVQKRVQREQNTEISLLNERQKLYN